MLWLGHEVLVVTTAGAALQVLLLTTGLLCRCFEGDALVLLIAIVVIMLLSSLNNAELIDEVFEAALLHDIVFESGEIFLHHLSVRGMMTTDDADAPLASSVVEEGLLVCRLVEVLNVHTVLMVVLARLARDEWRV